MSKLKKEELLRELKTWFDNYPFSDKWHQAYQQIRETIQRPEVTEEWIEEKTKELHFWTDWEEGLTYEEVEKFIRSLVKEIQGK